MRFYQMRLRTLFILTILCAILVIPAYKFSCQLLANWTADRGVDSGSDGVTIQLPPISFTAVNKVVSVSEGGLVGTGGHWFKPDGTIWAGGRMIEDSEGRRMNSDGIWELPKGE